MAIKRFRKTSLQDRLAECEGIARRFPKGGKDALTPDVQTLGNQFRTINSLSFRLVKTGTMKGR